MNYFDILLAKKMGGSAPLPENAYLLTTITDGDLTSAKSKPLPSVSVAVTDADEVDVFVGDSETITSDNEPYLYRQSKGGRMVSERLVGASVAWNQLVLDKSVNHTYTNVILTAYADGGYADISTEIFDKNIPVGHKLFMVLDVKNAPDNFDKVILTLGSASNLQNASNGRVETIKSIPSEIQYNFLRLYCTSTETVASIYVNAQMFDLTLMFGSTIADYVYSLEQSQAGSGIAWLKSYGFFSEDYYAYDSGSLKSVSVSEKKVVGFNQWDEQWATSVVSSETRVVNKNPIRVIPNKTYYFTAPATLYINAVTANGDYVRYLGGIATTKTLTIPSDVNYISFSISGAYGTTYNHDICINISDPAKNGTYEPYKLTTCPLPSSDLRGLYKLSSNKLYCDGDIQYGDGWRLRRYGIVDLGTLTWTYATNSDGLFFTKNISDCKNLICEKYIVVEEQRIIDNITADTYLSNMQCAHRYGSINDRLYFKNTSYSDAASFKTALSGVYLIYELATPVWEKTHPFTNPQTVGSTEEFVANLPAGHESKYYDGDIHHSYIYAGDARAKVTGDVDIVNGTAPNGTCSVCVVMPDGDEIWSDAGDVTAEIWT